MGCPVFLKAAALCRPLKTFYHHHKPVTFVCRPMSYCYQIMSCMARPLLTLTVKFGTAAPAVLVWARMSAQIFRWVTWLTGLYVVGACVSTPCLIQYGKPGALREQRRTNCLVRI